MNLCCSPHSEDARCRAPPSTEKEKKKRRFLILKPYLSRVSSLDSMSVAVDLVPKVRCVKKKKRDAFLSPLLGCHTTAEGRRRKRRLLFVLDYPFQLLHYIRPSLIFLSISTKKKNTQSGITTPISSLPSFRSGCHRTSIASHRPHLRLLNYFFRFLFFATSSSLSFLRCASLLVKKAKVHRRLRR